MTDTPHPADDTATLRESIAALTARLDQIEAQAARPSALDGAQARLTGAWDALRGTSRDPEGAAPTRQSRGLLWPVLTICAVLLALILAVELAEEVFDGLWHVGRWID
ncbi:hypothetical protein SAMN05421763_11610 [[Luteovulum] sphaeroides subsp. megalophilum]|uniref:hypothetical protein n=1 Tax=Cereibacter sphaeroides TaxID=1063 RepID=UPI000B66E67B|nr:hypothetical protein [Cereibacter sphaeroides]SNT41452.1 hypothetical protein SAMN05421763_11610 [[Luteovulum] sphaeroides subsp. megalophilum]